MSLVEPRRWHEMALLIVRLDIPASIVGHMRLLIRPSASAERRLRTISAVNPLRYAKESVSEDPAGSLLLDLQAINNRGRDPARIVRGWCVIF
jgi:hypothetical protein